MFLNDFPFSYREKKNHRIEANRTGGNRRVRCHFYFIIFFFYLIQVWTIHVSLCVFLMGYYPEPFLTRMVRAMVRLTNFWKTEIYCHLLVESGQRRRDREKDLSKSIPVRLAPRGISCRRPDVSAAAMIISLKWSYASPGTNKNETRSLRLVLQNFSYLYFENIPLKSCNIAKIFIKLLERFLKYCRNHAMSVQKIINGILLQYWYFILILLLIWELSSSFVWWFFK